MATHSDSYIPPTPAVQGVGGPPLHFQAVVDNGEMLNVGDADLFKLSWGMIFNPQTTDNDSGGVSVDSIVQGSWSYQSALCLGVHTVTVSAHIDTEWSSGKGTGSGGWNWWDLRDAFASALWATMQAVSNPTGYPIYRNSEEGGREVTCTPEEFVDWGHYIPRDIIITAVDVSGLPAGSVKVRYRTEDQSGVSPCNLIGDLGGGVAIFADPETAPLAAVVAAFMTVGCQAITGTLIP